VAKLRSLYDEPVTVPWLDDQVVKPGQVLAVPDGLLAHFLAAGRPLPDGGAGPGWEPADAATKKAASDLAKQGDGQEATTGQEA
jgi:hypothetical protein